MFVERKLQIYKKCQEYCTETFNFCEKSLKCIKHCTDELHGHCSASFCDSQENICEESSICINHCGFLNHGHCVYRGGCDDVSDICDENSS